MSCVLMTSWRNKRHYPNLCSSLIHNFLSGNVCDRIIGTLTQEQISKKHSFCFVCFSCILTFLKKNPIKFDQNLCSIQLHSSLFPSSGPSTLSVMTLAVLLSWKQWNHSKMGCNLTLEWLHWFCESSVASIITALTLTISVNGPLKLLNFVNCSRPESIASTQLYITYQY